MATDWQITSQREMEELMPTGSFEKHMEVRFTVIPEGIDGSIKIPVRLYTEDYIRNSIDAYAARIKAVQSL